MVGRVPGFAGPASRGLPRLPRRASGSGPALAARPPLGAGPRRQASAGDPVQTAVGLAAWARAVRACCLFVRAKPGYEVVASEPRPRLLGERPTHHGARRRSSTRRGDSASSWSPKARHRRLARPAQAAVAVGAE